MDYTYRGLSFLHAGIVQLINNAPKQTDPRVQLLLDPDELALYNSTTKPSKLCGTMLSALTSNAGFEVEREIYINQMLGQVAANVSQVARIKLQAMPFGQCCDAVASLLYAAHSSMSCHAPGTSLISLPMYLPSRSMQSSATIPERRVPTCSGACSERKP